MKKLIFLTITAIVFTIGVFTAIAVNNRGSAPVAYWKFNEGYGTTAYDAAGSNDGTITNAQWRNEPDCKSGKCLYFDGDGDYVDAGDQGSLEITASKSFTMEAWIKPIGGWAVIGKRGAGSGTEDGYELAVSGGALRGYFGDGSAGTGNVNFGGSMDDGKWHHIALTIDRDSDLMKGYIDGVQSGSNTDISSITGDASNSRPVCIGADGSNCQYNDFTGFIDDVRIYDYARTAAQIRADYLAGAGGRGAVVSTLPMAGVQDASEGLVGYWKMDETSWTNDCATDTVMDSSGAGNNGLACPNAGGLAPSSGKYGNAGLFDGIEDYIKIPDIDF